MSWMVRSVIVALVLGSGMSVCARGQSSDSRADAIADPAWLRAFLERERQAHRLPAIAAAVVIEGKIVAASAVGIRKAGSSIRVTRNDPFHLGSLVKPMSATMFAVLVDRGLLRWDMTMAEMFPQLVNTMKPDYRGVTIEQLLGHIGGFPYQPETSEGITDARASTLTGRRYEYVKAAIEDPPAAPPGTKVIYSGGGIVVASAAERLSRQSYETLMQRYLFKPLGMAHAGFGNTAATHGRIDGPWSHVIKADAVTPIPPIDRRRSRPGPRSAGMRTARSSTWPASPRSTSKEAAARAGSSGPRPSGGCTPPCPRATSRRAGRSSTPSGLRAPCWHTTGATARTTRSVAWLPRRALPSA